MTITAQGEGGAVAGGSGRELEGMSAATERAVCDGDYWLRREKSRATALGRYLWDTGTNLSWLARELGVSQSKVTRWSQGANSMSKVDRQRVMAVLTRRAAIPLEGLLDDQPVRGIPHRVRSRRRGVPESPFDRLTRPPSSASDPLSTSA